MARTDTYGGKMVPLNEYNDRLNAMNLAKKDVADPELDINYGLVEKRPPTTVIKGPVEVKEPPNLPDKLIFPERWEFYDGDMAVVKPSTTTGGLFAREDMLTFKLKENERNMLREYLQMQHRVPDPGYYDPIFKLLEEGIPVASFDRYLERSRLLTREEIMHRDMEGDVLILDPAAPKSEANGYVDMSKQKGRVDPTTKDRPDMGEEIVLDLDYKQVEPRVPCLVDMVT
jgi:hypothetical protein